MSGQASVPGRRGKRVAESIKVYLAEALHRQIDDPRLAGLSVTDIELTEDLSIARVSVRLLGDDAPELRRRALEALRHAGGRLRRELGSKLRLRRVPELRFAYDTGADAAERVAELLDEIEAERRRS
jgi:ribosome-binding factor A